jgi:hypothetical protein
LGDRVCPLRPLAATIAVLETMDEVRRQLTAAASATIA